MIMTTIVVNIIVPSNISIISSSSSIIALSTSSLELAIQLGSSSCLWPAVFLCHQQLVDLLNTIFHIHNHNCQHNHHCFHNYKQTRWEVVAVTSCFSLPPTISWGRQYQHNTISSTTPTYVATISQRTAHNLWLNLQTINHGLYCIHKNFAGHWDPPFPSHDVMMLYFGCPSASNVMTASIIEHPLITVYNATLADICHNWRWCTLFEPVPFFFHRERKILASFGQFGLFCC